MAVRVQRGAATSSSYSGTGRFQGFGRDETELRLSLAIPVSSGWSDISVKIDPAEFGRMVELMMACDEGATLKAFSDILREKAADLLEIHKSYVCIDCGANLDAEIWPYEPESSKVLLVCDRCGSKNIVTDDEYWTRDLEDG